MSLPPDSLCSAAGPFPPLLATDLSPHGPVIQLGPQFAAVNFGAVCVGPVSLQCLLVPFFLLLKRFWGVVHPSPSDGCPQPLGLTDAATPPTSLRVVLCSAGPLSAWRPLVSACEQIAYNFHFLKIIFSVQTPFVLAMPCCVVHVSRHLISYLELSLAW